MTCKRKMAVRRFRREGTWRVTSRCITDGASQLRVIDRRSGARVWRDQEGGRDALLRVRRREATRLTRNADGVDCLRAYVFVTP